MLSPTEMDVTRVLETMVDHDIILWIQITPVEQPLPTQKRGYQGGITKCLDRRYRLSDMTIQAYQRLEESQHEH